MALWPADTTPTALSLYLYEDATHYFSLEAFLEVGTVVSIADAVKRTYSFTSHGQFWYNVP